MCFKDFRLFSHTCFIKTPGKAMTLPGSVRYRTWRVYDIAGSVSYFFHWAYSVKLALIFMTTPAVYEVPFPFASVFQPTNL